MSKKSRAWIIVGHPEKEPHETTQMTMYAPDIETAIAKAALFKRGFVILEARAV